MTHLRHRHRNLLSKTLIIERQSWQYLSIYVDKSVQKNHYMFGSIEVLQKEAPQARNLDIAFYIMDNYEFADWQELRAHKEMSSIDPLNPLYATGKVSVSRWDFKTPQSGCYWLVWDNRYSWRTPKTVDIEANERWDEIIPEDVIIDAVTTSPPDDRSLLDEFIRIIGEARSRLMVVTPYIDMQVMNEIQKKINEGVEVYIITRSRQDFGGDQAKAAFDYLRRMLKGNHANNKQVHARFIVSDYDKVLVSSADLSHDSLIAEFNAGMVCTEPGIVKKMEEYFRLIWANSSKSSKNCSTEIPA